MNIEQEYYKKGFTDGFLKGTEERNKILLKIMQVQTSISLNINDIDEGIINQEIKEFKQDEGEYLRRKQIRRFG